ncbi:MAG TPA: hypothetical protein DCY93_01795 [Firmicutes bacterium]|nr:hypothetical protein [Bacillota bacterium]
MKKQYNKRKIILNLCLASMLGALGVLIVFIGGYFMRYPIAPWLVLEPSDTVVLVAYSMCGWQYAILCAIVKALVDLAIFGPTGPIAIGQITMVITSLVYVAAMFLCELFQKRFKHQVVWRIITYIVIIASVSSVMTFLNYLFITPTYLSWKPDSCFSYTGFVSNSMFPYEGSLILICILLYLPFNLLKGLIVCALFEILYNTIIVFFKKRFGNTKKDKVTIDVIQVESQENNEDANKIN